jgi:hypothetical protein
MIGDSRREPRQLKPVFTFPGTISPKVHPHRSDDIAILSDVKLDGVVVQFILHSALGDIHFRVSPSPIHFLNVHVIAEAIDLLFFSVRGGDGHLRRRGTFLFGSGSLRAHER